MIEENHLFQANSGKGWFPVGRRDKVSTLRVNQQVGFKLWSAVKHLATSQCKGQLMPNRGEKTAV